MSGRAPKPKRFLPGQAPSLKFSHDTKTHEGFLTKQHSMSRTRKLITSTREYPDEFFSLDDAEKLVLKYRTAIINPEYRQLIAERLVGRPKKLSNIRPNAALFESRLNDLMDLESLAFLDSISKEEMIADSVDTILGGGIFD
jgi:hypothetical protein